MFCIGFYLPLELTVQMCVCPSLAVPRPLYAHLKGFVPYASPVSVSILLKLALVMLLYGCTSFCNNP